MIKRRRLILDEHDVRELSGRRLAELVSDGVLSEGGAAAGRRIRFAHQFLFDYVAARLALRVETPATRSRVASDLEVALGFRPSLVLSFDRLWDVDASRDAFWEAAIAWVDEVSRAFNRLVPAVSAARSFRTPADVAPLLRCLEEPSQADEAPDRLLRLFIAAGVHQDKAMVGAGAADWCGLAHAMSISAMPRAAWQLRFLLLNLVKSPTPMSVEQLRDAGAAARALLAHALASNERLVQQALVCVARTASSDPIATATAIAPVLTKEAVAKHGFSTLQTLAFDIGNVISAAPALAGSIYEAAFTYEEESTEPVPMNDSQIMGMTSNRRQDFQSARYHLAEEFDELAAASIGVATKVVVAALDGGRRARDTARADVEFSLDGRGMRVRRDDSDYRFVPSHDDKSDPETLLSTWRRRVEQIVASPAFDAGIEVILDTLATLRTPALVWAEMLDVGAAAPDRFGVRLREMTWRTELLAMSELTRAIGGLITVIHPLVPPEQQERMEAAILSLPEFNYDPGDARDEVRAERKRRSRRAVLLGCIGSAVRSDAARVALAELSSLGGPAALPEGPRVVSGGWNHDDDEPPRNDTDPAADSLLRHSMDALAGVARWTIGSNVALIDLQTAEPAFLELDARIQSEHDATVALTRAAQLTLIDASVRAAYSSNLRSVAALRDLVVRILLRASSDEEPRGGPEAEAKYADFPSWSGPIPRADTARALPVLLRSIDTASASSDVRAAIRRLATDSSPLVRDHLADALQFAAKKDRPFAVEVAGEIVKSERQHRVVLGALVCLAPEILSAGNGIDLLRRAWDRAPTLAGKEAEGDVRALCARICLERHLRKGDDIGRDLLDEIVAKPVDHHAAAGAVASTLREEIKLPAGDGVAQARVRERRVRAVACFTRLCAATDVACKEWLALPPGERDQDRATHLVRFADHLSHQVLFASGQHDRKGPPQRSTFLLDLTPAIEHLADVAIVRSSFTLLKVLRYFRPVAARLTLRLARHVVVRASTAGLGVEQLAADEAVGLVEELFAENRDILTGRMAIARQARAEVADLLDVFVECGWPRAMKLTSRLHEVFA